MALRHAHVGLAAPTPLLAVHGTMLCAHRKDTQAEHAFPMQRASCIDLKATTGMRRLLQPAAIGNCWVETLCAQVRNTSANIRVLCCLPCRCESASLMQTLFSAVDPLSLFRAHALAL